MEYLQEAFNHLNKDKVMHFLINKFSKNIQINDRREANDSKSIANLIIEQQVSFKAAITIKNRFNIITKGLSNKQIIEMDEKKLQSIGISFKKGTPNFLASAFAPPFPKISCLVSQLVH